MNNAAALDRAFALIARLNDSVTPARSTTRAAEKVARLAGQKGSAALYWLSSALVEHKHALVMMALDEQKAAAHVVKRDRALELYATRSAQQL